VLAALLHTTAQAFNETIVLDSIAPSSFPSESRYVCGITTSPGWWVKSLKPPTAFCKQLLLRNTGRKGIQAVLEEDLYNP